MGPGLFRAATPRAGLLRPLAVDTYPLVELISMHAMGLLHQDQHGQGTEEHHSVAGEASRFTFFLTRHHDDSACLWPLRHRRKPCLYFGDSTRGSRVPLGPQLGVLGATSVPRWPGVTQRHSDEETDRNMDKQF